MSIVTASHHVTRVADPVEAATRAAQTDARQAMTDGLTELEAQRVYAKTYARVLADLTTVA